MDKFLFLKYSLIFIQVLTLISFTLFLSHVFEESLDSDNHPELLVDDYTVDDSHMWESRTDGLIILAFLLFLYCIITFGIYSVMEEKFVAVLVFLMLFVIWVAVFHCAVIIHDLPVPKKLLVVDEITSTLLSVIFLLMLKRLENLETVRVNELSKSVSTISDNLPFNPNYLV